MPHIKSAATLGVALISLVLFGCATDARRVDKEVGANQPEAYKAGYLEGCDSGYKAAGHPYYKFRKDVVRYGADELYKQGWDDGMNICKSKYQSYRL